MNTTQLNFLHLSDIHFIKPNGLDLDSDLRNEIEKDIKIIKKTTGKIHGILISGDIAYHAHENEYNEAVKWLEKISLLVECEKSNICIVPGNHDVDWAQQKEIFETLVEKLRSTNYPDVNDLFKKYLQGEESSTILFKHLLNYNNIALLYGCTTEASKPFWEKDFLLNDNSKLRVRGMNSAIISTENDNDAGDKLLLFFNQAITQNYEGITYLTLCHHPLSWLKDADGFEDYLNSRVRIQLFGHKHRQRLNKIDNSLRISAGAVHPSINEPEWEPRYNVLGLNVENISSQRMLIVKVWPRVFKKNSTKFEPEFSHEGTEYHRYELKLEPFEIPIPEGGRLKDENEKKGAKMNSVEEKSVISDRELRRIMYDFYNLSFTKFMEIATNLKILIDEDKYSIPFYKLKQNILNRIIEKKLIQDLEKELKSIK